MKKILRSFLLIFIAHHLWGQGPNNANRYNLFVQVIGTKYNPDNQDGTNHVTFLMDAAVDNNNTSDWLHNTDTGAGYSHSIIWDYDTPETRTDTKFYRTLLSQSNVADYEYDVSFMAFENNCGSRYEFNNCCGFACLGAPDKGGTSYKSYWNTKYQNDIGDLYDRWINTNQSVQIHLRHGWRYYRGEGQDLPLAFGTLTPGNRKNHLNWNRTSPSGTSSRIGYKNNWSSAAHPAFDDSPDVTYSFTVSQPSRLNISTHYGATNYDTRIHLVKNLPGTAWEIVASSSASDFSSVRSTLNEVVDAGDYFLIIEGDAGATGKFEFYIDNTPVSFDGGAIAHAMPWVQAGCSITEPVTSSTEASNNFGETITYDWNILAYASYTNNDQEITITDIITLTDAGPTLDPGELVGIGDSAIVQRIAKTEHMERSSQKLTIHALKPGSSFEGIPAEPGHNGKVEGRVVGEGTDIGIADVNIELIPFDNIHGACPDHPTTTTDENGYFTFNRVYYGLLAEDISGKFKVVASLENHGFNKDTTIIAGFNLDNPNNDNLESSPIQDTTTFFIRGLVFQEDDRSWNQTNCGVPDVRFYVDDGSTEILKIPVSDDQGNYAVDIATIGNYAIRTDLDHHDFLPNSYANIYVDNDVDDINFKDITTNTLSGSVRACGGYFFGSVELLIEDTDGCFVFRDTTDASGNFNIELPARAYNISITDYQDPDLENGYFIENIQAYFDRQTITADLDTGDYDIDLIYRQELLVEIEGIETNSCGDYIFDQVHRYPIDIYIREVNTNGCLLDTGSLVIIDHITGLEQAVYPISQGKVTYTIYPGDPNFAGDYTKLISFTARHIDSTYLPTTEQVNGIITGYKSREATFTTVSPEIPFLILRDPPGDKSYSYFKESSSTNLSLGISVLKGGSVNVWKKARLGSSVSISAPMSPISFNSDVWGEIGGSTTVGFNNTTSTEGSLEFTHTSEYKTSELEEPWAIGQNADVYVGAAMSLRYSKADILEYDSEACEVATSVDLVMGDAQMQTEFAYTEHAILTSIIPSLESNREASVDPVDINYYQDQIDLWNQMIDWNAELKENATVNTAYATRSSSVIPGHQSSLSWSAQGQSQRKEMTTTSSSKLSFEFNLEIDKELSAELGYNVAGSGKSGGVNVRTRFEMGVSSSIEVQKSRTTGFFLSDNDEFDRFETTVYNCPVYGTPIFKGEASITSCPYETGSSPIDAPQLTVEEPIDIDVDPEGNAGFTFYISNQSQDEKTRSYELDIVGGTNPHNATINADLPLKFPNMPYGTTQQQFISISRENADEEIFSFEGLEFILRPIECDANGEYASSKVKVSAYFNSTCSGVSLFEPQDGWIANSQANNTQMAWIKDYTEEDLNQIILQYSPSGLNSWFTAVGPLTPEDLNDNGTNGTIVNWNLANVNDGDYDLRLKLTCNSGSIFTERVTGTIDRMAPSVHGFPMPVDDIYDPSQNDEIGINMSEEIRCEDAEVLLIDLETQDTIAASISCGGAELLVNPVELLENRAPSAYRVVLNGVKDIYNNTSAEIRWVFIVGDYVYDPNCNPIEISNNNLNQDAISQSIYRSLQISSDGMIADNHTIGFKAEESIILEPGFEVVSGGALIAEIENCQE